MNRERSVTAGTRPGDPRWHARRHRGILLAALAVMALLGGCAIERAPLTVVVRDHETRAPVAGALVTLRPVFLFDAEPASNGKMANPRAEADGAGTSGRTGPDGAVRLDGTTTHAMQVTVSAAGYAPLQFYAEEHPARAGAASDRGRSMAWVVDDAVAGGIDMPSLEAQLRAP